ncbi:hypothetical protein NEF87_003660 [Candidatus Lokiarchaeum ossiferum]|uniref:CopG family transcriptional regulator n=1 Tax=Candidatus Lokiarchaeum ossiferum TaxID=2951803 RepID=A0ABY6HVD7_9ARCH|nr:hypothetical protein NEF87_003660 [Candidatus Lokiarchaeum sp. B-35]
MPIVSMNISDSMKRFLKRMVGTQEYKNSSNVMRDALVRLMSSKEDGVIGPVSLDKTDFSNLIPSITSSIIITLPTYHSKLDKKLNRIEINYHSSIIHKSIFTHQNIKTITYVMEDTMVNTQSFITELNAMESLQAFRYIINEPEE